MNCAFGDCKKRLEQLSYQNQKLQQRLQESEEANIISNEQAQYCQQEINLCLNNLTDLKEKMQQETDLVNQKVMECAQLQSQYNQQCCAMENLRKQLDTTNIYYQDEILTLKYQVNDVVKSF